MAVSKPGPIPSDPAHEDLSRVEYPSLANVRWHPHFVRPEETLESLFGPDWPFVARFNRIDRRHVYPGMTIKVPDDMAACRSYTPVPQEYEPAKRHKKYILIDLTEQWIGAYEYGKLKFSMPAATGAPGHDTPAGLFQIDARDKNHASSLYKTEDQSNQYPMDNAMRFHVGADDVAYWIHARDLPGKPASHGCVGVYDEAMQKRVYGVPERPVLLDSEKLWDWAVADLVSRPREIKLAEERLDPPVGAEFSENSAGEPGGPEVSEKRAGAPDGREVPQEGAGAPGGYEIPQDKPEVPDLSSNRVGGAALLQGGPMVEVRGQLPHYRK